MRRKVGPSVPCVHAQLIGRTGELGQLLLSVAGRKGAVLVGPAGVGKSRLAIEVAEQVSPEVVVHRVNVTAGAATVPLGPFVQVAPGLGEVVGGADLTASVYAHVVEALRGPKERQTLLLIDDAHLLDEVSSGLVHQLVAGQVVTVVATVRSGESVPPAVVALWKDLGCERLDLAPLNRTATTDLAGALLGAPVDGRTAAELWRWTQGNPLELRELLLCLRDDGHLIHLDGYWSLEGELRISPRLIDLVADRLARVSDDLRHATESIASGEPLDAQVAAVVIGPERLEALERRGLLRVVGSSASRVNVELAHPLYGEVLRAELSAARGPEVARQLVDAHEAVRGAVVDPLRLATWRLEAGLATADELADAARLALVRTAYALAARLGRASLELAESHDALATVGSALAALGDLSEAERCLRRAVELAPDHAARTWAVVALAHAWHFHGGRYEQAVGLLEAQLELASTPAGSRDALVGELALLHMTAGNLPLVARAAQPLISDGHASHRTRLLALVATSMTQALMLLPEAARASVQEAWPLVEQGRNVLPTVEDLLHANLYAADLSAGDLAAARRRVDEHLQRSLELGRGDLSGFWTFLRAQLWLYEGHPRRSYDAAVEAARLLAQVDVTGSRPLAQIEAAYAAAVCGRLDLAEARLAEVAPEARALPRFRSRLDLVAAFVAVGGPGLARAADLAVEAGDRAREDGILLWAGEAWHLAVRLGAPQLAETRLAALAVQAPGTAVTVQAAHASALVAGDVDALVEVARRFAAHGYRLLGAEAAAQATTALRRGGEARRVRQVAALAREILPADAGAATPAIAELRDAPPLTPREREIALLAARGMTSREIAVRLGLSSRTVDNRLAGVYDKLGIAGRQELGSVFGEPPALPDRPVPA